MNNFENSMTLENLVFAFCKYRKLPEEEITKRLEIAAQYTDLQQAISCIKAEPRKQIFDGGNQYDVDDFDEMFCPIATKINSIVLNFPDIEICSHFLWLVSHTDNAMKAIESQRSRKFVDEDQFFEFLKQL